MGYEIVYCAACQSQVRGTDLEKHLAIRLNENRIAGNIQAQRKLTINMGGGQTTTLEFTLYVVPAGA